MNHDVRRRALWAAARVALPFSLTHCALALAPLDPDAAHTVARDASPDVSPDVSMPVDVTHDAAAEVDAGTTTMPDAHACPGTDPTGWNAGDDRCCRDQVSAAVAAAQSADAGLVDPGVLACCSALATYYDTHSDPWQYSNERYYCCSALDWQGSGTCTPWGPPVPPVARESHAAQRSSRPPARLDLRAAAAKLRPALPDVAHLYESAQATWRGRMVNEYESAEVFSALAGQLARAGVDAVWARACADFASEERRHGVLCGAVVEALGGAAVAEGTERAAFPEHGEVGALEGALRNVLSVCCLSETVAVALIGAERLEMPEGALRDLLTGIWADEVGHARFGWRLLASVADSLDEGARARLGDYLTTAFAHLEAHELRHLPLATPPAEGAALGLCRGADARELFYATVRDVIIPALESAGIPARRAWAQRGERALAA